MFKVREGISAQKDKHGLNQQFWNAFFSKSGSGGGKLSRQAPPGECKVGRNCEIPKGASLFLLPVVIIHLQKVKNQSTFSPNPKAYMQGQSSSTTLETKR